jgi:hypothetical protein
MRVAGKGIVAILGLPAQIDVKRRSARRAIAA